MFTTLDSHDDSGSRPMLKVVLWSVGILVAIVIVVAVV